MNQSAAPTPQGGTSTMKWLLIVLVLVIVLGGGYLVYAKYGQGATTTTASPLPATTVTSSPSATVSPSETPTSSSLETFDYAGLFSFKFSSGSGVVTTRINNDKDFSVKQNGQGILTIIVDESSGKTLDQIIQDKTNNFLIKDSKKITFGGQSAYEGVGLGLVTYYDIYAISGTKLVHLTFNVKSTDETLTGVKNGLSAIQNQILSTFQFTK